MIIYGAGGHAQVIFNIIKSMGGNVDMIIDDDPFRKEISGHPVTFGYNKNMFPDQPLIVAIGDNQHRRRVAEKIHHHVENVVHPTAYIEPSAFIGIGNVFMAKCIVQSGVRMENHIILNTGAIVEHDCHLEDFVHVAPGSILCGGVKIGENTLIGAGSVVLPGIRIGKNCIVGAGSIVTRDVSDGQIVAGKPAKSLH